MIENKQFAGSIKFYLRQQTLWLLPQKAIYWQEKNTLIMADIHLGKAGHFRKAGIPVPSAIHRDDIAEIRQLIALSQAERVLILGDLFHSEYNKEWLDFEDFLHQESTTSFILVKGNHDILPHTAYQQKNLQVAEESLTISPFYFTHQPAFHLPEIAKFSHPEPIECLHAYYNLSGHVHPGISLRGNVGQNLKLPCFFFSRGGGILPAFGKFTGFVNLKKHPKDMVFGILTLTKWNKQVLKID